MPLLQTHPLDDDKDDHDDGGDDYDVNDFFVSKLLDGNNDADLLLFNRFLVRGPNVDFFAK